MPECLRPNNSANIQLYANDNNISYHEVDYIDMYTRYAIESLSINLLSHKYNMN